MPFSKTSFSARVQFSNEVFMDILSVKRDQIDQLLAAQGQETSSTNENYMALEGPRCTAKTGFARIVAEIPFFSGKVDRPGRVCANGYLRLVSP